MGKRLIISGLLLFCLFDLLVYSQENDTLPDTQLIIRDIVIEGNRVTKENIFLRELLFSEGDTLLKMELLPAFERSRENLLNLSLFNFVTFDAKHLPDQRIDVVITVTERWYIWPTPIFEFADRNLSSFLQDFDWSHMNYGMWLQWNNFRGQNEILSAKVRLGYKEQYMLEYIKPNIGKSQNHKLAFGYSFMRQHRVNYMTSDNKPVYYKIFPEYALNLSDGYIAYTYRKELYSSHKFRLHYTSDWVSDSVSIKNPNYFGNGRDTLSLFKFDYVYTYDVRDSKIYPLEGISYKVKAQRFGLGVGKNYDYPNWTLEGTFFYHKKISDRFYLANITRAKTASNKRVPFVQNSALGYSEYMTGYEYYVIDGSDYFMNKFIAKIQLVKPGSFQIPFIRAKQFNRVHYAVYLNILGDIGYVYDKFPDPNIPLPNYMVNELQYSGGIGLDIVTYYDKVFRLEYAINRYGFKGFYFHLETPFFRW